MPSAHVRPHNGTPTLFLNDAPVYAAMHWLAGGFDPDGSFQNDYAVREFARAGVHINALGIAPAWCGTAAPATPDADLKEAGRLLRAVLTADPQALFHLRIYLETGSWWNERFPDECEVASDGSRLNASYASDVWQAHVLEYVDRLVNYLRAEGLYDCVIAYQLRRVGEKHHVDDAADRRLQRANAAALSPLAACKIRRRCRTAPSMERRAHHAGKCAAAFERGPA